MIARRLTLTCFLVAGFFSAYAQDIATQVNEEVSTGSIHMDTTTAQQVPDGPTSTHGLDLEFLKTRIQNTMDQAIAKGELPGGVVAVMRNNEIVHLESYGNRAVEPEVEAATTGIIYDMASLTKPIVTATSIMILVQRGEVRLTDPVTKFIPEWVNSPEENTTGEHLRRVRSALETGKIRFAGETFAVSDPDLLHSISEETSGSWAPELLRDHFNLLPRDRESITIRHLLTHTSGLPPFFRYFEQFPEGDARNKIIIEIARADLRGPVGGQFIYSDLGFILLAEIVERVANMRLDQFAQKEIFGPLGMSSTMFNPPQALHGRIAPTEWTVTAGTSDTPSTKSMIRGLVHDGNAKVQNGVSGHAGLFSTAEDLTKFVKMLSPGKRRPMSEANILSPATIELMTTNQAKLGSDAPGRGLGWDLTSNFNSQRGDIFQSGYGHTGFTGTSIWVVPEEKLAIIILSNRVHPNGKGDVTSLRAKIANIVAGSITESYRKEHSEN